MKKRRIITWLVIILALSGLYFFTRLVSIRSLPPFNDEFIYVRWAQQGFLDPAKRLWSLSDGKQPLYIWLTSLAMNIISSPLAAGRIVSIVSGFAAMIGLFVLSWQLLKNRFVTITSAILYILSPYALVLDRFALYDSLLAALSIWSMVIMYQMTLQPTLGASLVLALLLGAALLTKSSAILLIIMLPLAIFFFAKVPKQKLSVLFYFALAVLLAFLYQSVQHLYPGDLVTSTKNSVFIYTLRELSTTPLVPLVTNNISLYFSWITFYLTFPLLIVTAAVWFLDRPNRRAYAYLMLTFLVPFAIVVTVGKLIYPRHLFFFFVPIYILAAAGIVKLSLRIGNSLRRWVFIGFCLLPVGSMTARTLIDFKTAPLPSVSRFQYIDGWPAGWGVKEIVRFLGEESTKGDITVLTEGIYGSMPTTAMLLYFSNYPQVHIIPIDDTKPLAIPKGLDWQHPVYFILNRQQDVSAEWNATEVLKIQKGRGNSYIRLLKIHRTP